MKPDLIILRGLPGSGKSTKALEFAAQGYTHYEADQYFMVDGEYRFSPTQLSDAHKWCLEGVTNALDEGYQVVVSNTFTTYKEVAPYLDLCVDTQIITCKGTWPSIHNVPEETLERMRARWVNTEDFPNEVFSGGESV